MIKAEPRTILSFLNTYFEVVRDLFDHQAEDGILRKETLNRVCEKHGTFIQSKLKEYRVIRQIGEDFEMRDAYFKMMEFLLLEFKPLLPETIEKYKLSISELFIKIRKSIAQQSDRDILQERIKNLNQQIREFVDMVEKNTWRLLNETRDLKSNIERVEYRDKVHKASFWIEYYILPLNRILDVNHAESIAQKLLEVSEFANQKRLDFDDETVRVEFEKLYVQLIQTNGDMLKQSKILTNELLPLLERIRTESLILTGWIEFLRNPYKADAPRMLKPTRGMPYAKDMLFKVREFFEQFQHTDNVYVEEDNTPFDKWIFDRELFHKKLSEQLPVPDFFSWCEKELYKDFKEIDTDKFFAMTGLIFDQEFTIEYSKKGERTNIKTNTSKLSVPKLRIEEKERIK
ncbi:MAG: hypothetical protein SH856_01515 [Flavobacteriales bacterium]|nr:hypothetical protein [Flavobacteriales bacterium]